MSIASALYRESMGDAVRRRISTRDLAIVVVGTAHELRSDFEALPGVDRVDVVPFDRE